MFSGRILAEDRKDKMNQNPSKESKRNKSSCSLNWVTKPDQVNPLMWATWTNKRDVINAKNKRDKRLTDEERFIRVLGVQ